MKKVKSAKEPQYKGEVKNVDASEVEPNKENPRKIFDDAGMKKLKESIAEVGILVPILVYYDDGKYIILDGERRWRCASELKHKTIPANVIAKPTTLENILMMFNIHKTRKQWNPVETAWKLEKIVKLTGKKKERELSELTGMTISEVRRCRLMLSMPKRLQDRMFTYFKSKDAANEDKGIKPDFFIEFIPIYKEIQNNYPIIFDRFEKDFFDKLIDKYENKIIKSVTEARKLRRIFSSVKATATNEEKHDFENKIIKFLDKKEIKIADLEDTLQKFSSDNRTFLRACTTLINSFDDINPSKLSDPEKKELQKNLTVIIKKSEQLLKRLEG